MVQFFWILALLVAVAVEKTKAQLILYNSSAAINFTQPLSVGCQNAMLANISCPIQLLYFAGEGDLVASDNVTVPQICGSSCTKSLASYHQNVATACAKDPQPWTGLPATWPGDVMWAYANRTCLKNSTTGQYCVDEVLSWWTTLDTNDTLLSNYPKQYLCTHCMIQLLAQSQSTSFSNYNQDFVSDWQGVQAACNVSYPTIVQPSQTNLTIASMPNFVNTSGLAPVPCISGNNYTVQIGDTCTSISISKNVAGGTLLIINNLLADCSGLIAGASICLPQTCSTYQVKTNDTCWSIASTQSIGVYQLQSWNPALNPGCTNLITGTTICLSPPGGTWNGTTIAGATPTQLSPYATTTVPPPGPTPQGTTSQCGAYYEAVSGDYCQQISLNQTITVDLFEAINPSINVNCTNLSPGFYYCVYPTLNWNATSINCTALTPIAAPAPTTSGVAKPCYGWYTIQSGDTCSFVEIEFGISFAQLQAWNPNLTSTCSNLILGDAYCVNGNNSTCAAKSSVASTVTSTSKASSTSKGKTSSAASSKTSSTSTGKTSSAASSKTSSTSTTSSAIVTPTPHQPNMASGCKTFYEAVSGDTCSGIATTYGITLTQFYAWNPDVGNTCSTLLANEWYCVGM